MTNFNNHIHYYDWIISWDFNSDGRLIFSMDKHSATEICGRLLADIPDVERGIYECKKAIEWIRLDQQESIEPRLDALASNLFALKHPPPPPPESPPAFDDEDDDYIPF